MNTHIPVRERDGWGGAHGPLLIAEIGGNHEGDFGYAKALTELAIGSGADVIKFQVYYADDLVNPVVAPDRHRHFRRFELTPDQHIELAEMCVSSGVEYLASVWSIDALDWLDPYLGFYKIGSGDLNATSILRAHAERGKPIVLSTGLSTIAEVSTAVEEIRSTDPRYGDPRRLAVLQCTSTYPLPKHDANLRALGELRRATGATIGYSDHTTDSQALQLAVALGAEVLEFHFTDTRDDKQFRDHAVSLTAGEVRELIDAINDVAALLGDGVKRPLPTEVAAGHVESFRRGLYFSRDLDAGHVITPDDVLFRRPVAERSASEIDDVIGRRLTVDASAFESCAVECFEAPTETEGRGGH